MVKHFDNFISGMRYKRKLSWLTTNMIVLEDSIAVGRTQINSRKLSWFTTNMIVAYALPVVEEVTSFTYMKAEISLEFKMWKDAMMEEINSLQKNDT